MKGYELVIGSIFVYVFGRYVLIILFDIVQLWDLDTF